MIVHAILVTLETDIAVKILTSVRIKRALVQLIQHVSTLTALTSVSVHDKRVGSSAPVIMITRVKRTVSVMYFTNTTTEHV